MKWRKRYEPWVGLAVVLFVALALVASAQDVATWQSITYDESNRAHPVYWEDNANVFSARFLIPSASTGTVLTVPLNAQPYKYLVYQLAPDAMNQDQAPTATNAPKAALLGSAYIDNATYQFQAVARTITGATTVPVASSLFYEMQQVELGGLPWVAFKITGNTVTSELFVTMKR